MILAIDTSTPECRVWLIDGEDRRDHTWNAGRNLADGILRYLRELLVADGRSWRDIESIVVFKGPGSFTGLRIGLTVMNTLADTYSLPIVGETGDAWLSSGLERLSRDENDGLVMPLYGREPNITKPRK